MSIHKLRQYWLDNLPRREVLLNERIDLSNDELNKLLDAAGMTKKELIERLGISRNKMASFATNGYPTFLVRFLKIKANIRVIATVADFTGHIESKYDLLDMMARNGLTYANVAKILNVSTMTLKRWLSNGNTPKYARETMVLFLLIGDLFYNTYGVIHRRDFHPAHLRYIRLPRGMKLDSSPRRSAGVGNPNSCVGFPGKEKYIKLRKEEKKRAEEYAAALLKEREKEKKISDC